MEKNQFKDMLEEMLKNVEHIKKNARIKQSATNYKQ